MEKYEAYGLNKVHNQWEVENGRPDWEDDPEGFEDWGDRPESWAYHNELIAPCYPQPDTPNWYRCWGYCHDLAAWNGAVGKAMFPDDEWIVLHGRTHACAYSDAGLYMDILWSGVEDKSLAEIEEAVWEDALGFTVEEEIEDRKLIYES
jgi:hypothetical protein